MKNIFFKGCMLIFKKYLVEKINNPSNSDNIKPKQLVYISIMQKNNKSILKILKKESK